MSRRLAALLLGAALGVLAVGGAYLWLQRPSSAGTAPPAAASEAPAEATVTPAEEPWEVKLYFPSTAGLLAPETREIAAGATPSESVGRVVRALLDGPTVDGLVAAFPPEVVLARALVMPDGTAYVDLRGAEGAEPPAAGSEMEMLSVFALVDTVMWAVPDVERVVLLWNGEQRQSFSGHVNTGSPLVANRRLLTSPP